MAALFDRSDTAGAEGAHGVAISVRNVTKTFKVHHERATSLKQVLVTGARNRYDTFYALRDVSFEVADGEAVGIIGHNGSGKSTMLKCLAGILQPQQGSIQVNRRMAALLELGAGFHPDLTGRDNVFLNAAILGMTRREIADRFDDIVEFSGLEEFIDTPVKNYSSGMYVRLAFAVAINVDPELLLIDEIMAVGDVTFQQKCMEKFVTFREQGRTLVIVTHDLTNVRNFCDRAIWLDRGVIRGEGPPEDLVDVYTETMLSGEQPIREGPSRRGEGPLRIDHVELLDANGEPTERILTGDSVVVRLHWHSDEPVANPVFALTLARIGGAVITEPTSRDVGHVPASLVGRGTLDVAFPAMPLLPGPYVIHAEATGYGRQHVFEHVRNALRFDVMAGNTPETDGLVTLSPSWRNTDGSVWNRNEG